MSESSGGKRFQLVRDSAVFQLKLLVDGLRDFVLVPVSLVATLIGLFRSAEDPEREFHQVLEAGRRSERWINLFGTHEPFETAGDAGSIDRVLARVEDELRRQTREGGISRGAGESIRQTLESLRRRAEEAGPDERSGERRSGQ